MAFDVTVLHNNIPCNGECSASSITYTFSGYTLPISWYITQPSGGFPLCSCNAIFQGIPNYRAGGTITTGNSVTIAGLCAGSYGLLAMDATYQTITKNSFPVISEPDIFRINTSKVNPTCSNSDGSITVNIIDVGGGIPFKYQIWEQSTPSVLLLDITTTSLTQTLNTLPFGVYVIKVQSNYPNNNGYPTCEQIKTVTLVGTSSVSSDVSVAQPSCQCDGSIRLFNVTGGTPPYTYLWSTGDTTDTITGLCPGTYYYNIVDSLGCSLGGITTLSYTSPIISIYTKQNIIGSTLGSITLVQTSGGTTPYTYLWNTGEITDSISGLQEGEYAVQVSDNFGCANVFTFSIISQCQEFTQQEYNAQVFTLQCCISTLTNTYLNYLAQGREDLGDCILSKLMLGSMILRRLLINPNPADSCLECSQIQNLINTLKCLCPCIECEQRVPYGHTFIEVNPQVGPPIIEDEGGGVVQDQRLGDLSDG